MISLGQVATDIKYKETLLIFFTAISAFNHRLIYIYFFSLGFFSIYYLISKGFELFKLKNIQLILFSYFIIPLIVLLNLIQDLGGTLSWSEFDNPSRLIFSAFIFLYAIKNPFNHRAIYISTFTFIVFSFFASLMGSHNQQFELTHSSPNVYASIQILYLSLLASILDPMKKYDKYYLFLIPIIFMGIYIIYYSGSKFSIFLSMLFLIIFIRNIFSKSYALYFYIVFIFLVGYDFYIEGNLSQKYFILYRNLDCFISSTDIFSCSFGSLGTRIWMYYAALNNIIDNPLLGSGLDSTSQVISIAISKGLIPSIAHYSHFHNDFLELGSQLGLPGMLGFVALYFLPLHFAKKYSTLNPFSRALNFFAITAIIISFVNSSLVHSATTTYIALNLAILSGSMLGHELKKI